GAAPDATATRSDFTRDERAVAPAPEPQPVANSRFEGVAELDPGKDIAAQLALLADEVIAHLKAGGADSLNIEVSIDATRYTGFDADTVRTVAENARTLGLKPGRFTEG
ncbi:hypothetical protein, partial [Actinomyces oris]